jgi:hypothetical protein
LRLGHGHGQALPADQHAHVGGAGVPRCYTLDCDFFPLLEGRNDLAGTMDLA